MSEKRKRILNDNFLTKRHLKSNTLSKVDSKLIAIPHGALCGSQQIRKINLFKLSYQTLPSSSSDSGSSESSSERLFKNIKIKNAFTLTPEYENFNVDCTPPNLLKDSDASNSVYFKRRGS